MRRHLSLAKNVSVDMSLCGDAFITMMQTPELRDGHKVERAPLPVQREGDVGGGRHLQPHIDGQRPAEPEIAAGRARQAVVGLADDSRLRGSAHDPERPSEVVAERRMSLGRFSSSGKSSD
jgi:hypothetical protein